MCCLKYEQNAYEDAVKRMPKNDSFVDTPDGIGNVSNVDLLREEVSVRLDASPESPKKFKNCEIRVLRNGKGSRDGIEIPKDRPQRYVAPVEQEEVPVLTHRAAASYDVISIPSVLASEHEESAEPQEKEKHTSRRRHRGGRRSSGKAKIAETAEKAPKAEKPAEKKADKPTRPPRGGKTPAKAEKLTVRPSGDTTAEKKAAADRAAMQQTGHAKSGEGKTRRHRPRHRPRGKGGQGSAE